MSRREKLAILLFPIILFVLFAPAIGLIALGFLTHSWVAFAGALLYCGLTAVVMD